MQYVILAGVILGRLLLLLLWLLLVMAARADD